MKPLHYLFITDPHYYGQTKESLKANLTDQMKAVADEANTDDTIDFVVIGGDITTGMYGSKEATFSDIDELLAPVRNCRKPLLILNGNHDDNSYHIYWPSSYRPHLFLSEHDWRCRLLDVYGPTDAVHDTRNLDSRYYYWDCKGTRIVCLDACDTRTIADETGTVTALRVLNEQAHEERHYATGASYWGYSEEQIRWLKEEALTDKTADYLIFSHMGIDQQTNAFGNPVQGAKELGDTLTALQHKTVCDGFDAGGFSGSVKLYQFGHQHLSLQWYDEPRGFWKVSTTTPELSAYSNQPMAAKPLNDHSLPWKVAFRFPWFHPHGYDRMWVDDTGITREEMEDHTLSHLSYDGKKTVSNDVYLCSCTADGGLVHGVLKDGVLTLKEKVDLPLPMYSVKQGDALLVLLKGDHENAGTGRLVSVALAKDGTPGDVTDLGDTHGLVPCHLCQTNGRVYAVNYLSGNVIAFPQTVVQHSGKGPHPTRQDGPHTHCIVPTRDDRLVVTDLGTDQLTVYDADLNPVSSVALPAGKGPRHLQFSGDGKRLYCVNELAGDVSVLTYADGVLTYLDSYPIDEPLPQGNTAAAIRLYDDNLFVSHRGKNCISRYTLNQDGLTYRESTDCMGVGPRDFLCVNDHLLCTNEGSNSVTVFRLEDGKPVYTGQSVSLPCPIAVVER